MFDNDTNYEQFCHITLKSFKSLIHIIIQKHFDIFLSILLLYFTLLCWNNIFTPLVLHTHTHTPTYFFISLHT